MTGSDQQPSRVLVTGGSGFIGTNLIASLVADNIITRNYSVETPLDSEHIAFWQRGDILDRSGLEKAFTEFLPTHVVHLAARTDLVGTQVSDYAANVDGTRNVLEAAKNCGSVKRIIAASTMLVCRLGYQPKDQYDVCPNTVYGESKAETERITRELGDALEWLIVRPTTIWGPWHMRHARTLFPRLEKGRYYHPGRSPCRRAYGYVGNVAFQLRKLLIAPRGDVHGQMFYTGDPPMDLTEWLDCLSRELAGKSLKYAPRWLFRLAALAGDVIGRCGVSGFPVTSYRLRNMTADNILNVGPTIVVTGSQSYSMPDAVRDTVTWYRTGEYRAHRLTPEHQQDRAKIDTEVST